MEGKAVTIDEKTTLWNNRKLLTSFISVVVATNAFNAYIHQQETNTVAIAKDAKIEAIRDEYNKERSDKKDERILEDTKTLILINNLENKVVELTEKLKKCR